MRLYNEHGLVFSLFMSDKNHILLSLQQGLKGSPKSRGDAVKSRLVKNIRGIVPKRSSVSKSKLVDLFISGAEAVDAVCERVDDLAGVVGVVKGHVKEHGLGRKLWVSGDEVLGGLSWGRGFDLVDGVGDDIRDNDDLVGVSLAYCGIAETGSLVFVSGGGLSLVQNFLCADSVVVLFEDDILGSYEDFRDMIGDDFLGRRGVIFVTGPSRTGDIAQTLELGAHGALRLRIILVKSKK